MVMQPVEEKQQPNIIFRSLAATWTSILVVLFTAGVALILLFPVLPSPQQTDLSVGDIATEAIVAPRDLTYISTIETEAERAAAAARVDDIYGEPDPRIGRQQVRLAGQILDFVGTVREDNFASTDLQLAYLDAVQAVELSTETAELLIGISDEEFDSVEREVVDLVEEAMSGEVRESRLDNLARNLPLEVSTDIRDELVPAVVAVSSDLIVPNTFLDEAATQAAIDAAVANVPEVRRSYATNEAIVRAGERVDELDLEALEEFGLTEPEQVGWLPVIAASIASVLCTTVLAAYVSWRGDKLATEPGRLTLYAFLFLTFLLLAQVAVSFPNPFSLLFPIAALALAFTALLNLEYAVIAVAVMALLTGYMDNFSLETATTFATMGIFAAGSLRRDARLNAYFVSGMIAALAGIAVLLAFRLGSGIDPSTFGSLAAVILLNGLLSAGISLVIILAVGNFTDMTTSLQLIDLTRPDHPLQKKLQQEAIGTYHHTLAVANLAEAAAEAIGANSLLTRVGVLYHDIGKTTNPGFFIENRIEGAGDAYEQLSPVASARIIKSHVSEGVKMARPHLPPPVIAFIREHHGKRSIRFFLEKARKAAEAKGEELDESPFIYDGPKPQSKETGITMLADACESATRANRPSSGEEIEKIVDSIFEHDINSGQLIECGLSLRELSIIREEFIRTLKGMYHPRIKYPEEATSKVPSIGEELDLEQPEATSLAQDEA